MSTTRSARRRPSAVALIAIFLLTFIPAIPVSANNTAQSLPFSQDWTDTGLITTDDDWSGVPGIVGFLGQDITTATGVDPQTLLTDSTVANDVDVMANQVEPNVTNGGVAEFQGNAMFPFPNPVVALQGSGTADAPHIVINLDTTGRSERLGRLRPARHRRYRRQRRPAGRPPLPGRQRAAMDQPPRRLRRRRDDGSEPGDAGHAGERPPPGCRERQGPRAGPGHHGQRRPHPTSGSASTTSRSRHRRSTRRRPSSRPRPRWRRRRRPRSEHVGDVQRAGRCHWRMVRHHVHDELDPHRRPSPAVPMTFSINPDTDFVNDETCTFTVFAQNVTDQDADDPPDLMAADHVATFSTVSAVAAAGPRHQRDRLRPAEHRHGGVPGDQERRNKCGELERRERRIHQRQHRRSDRVSIDPAPRCQPRCWRLLRRLRECSEHVRLRPRHHARNRPHPERSARRSRPCDGFDDHRHRQLRGEYGRPVHRGERRRPGGHRSGSAGGSREHQPLSRRGGHRPEQLRLPAAALEPRLVERLSGSGRRADRRGDQPDERRARRRPRRQHHDHVQRAGQRRRRLVRDRLRHDARPHGHGQRRPDDLHARPDRRLRGGRVVHRHRHRRQRHRPGHATTRRTRWRRTTSSASPWSTSRTARTRRRRSMPSRAPVASSPLLGQSHRSTGIVVGDYQVARTSSVASTSRKRPPKPTPIR